MTRGQTVLVVLGFVLHALVGWWYLVTGLLVPGPYLYILWAAWVVFLSIQIVNRRRPVVVFSTPFVAAAIWLVFVQGLGSLLDWKA
ncbi:MAG: hypothetical protein ACRDJP_14435 [Actinomycetota bacterium]